MVWRKAKTRKNSARKKYVRKNKTTTFRRCLENRVWISTKQKTSLRIKILSIKIKLGKIWMVGRARKTKEKSGKQVQWKNRVTWETNQIIWGEDLEFRKRMLRI